MLLNTLLSQFAQQSDAGAVAAAGGVGIIGLLFQVAVYAFFGYCMMTIAKKLGDENAWWAFVPILNLVQAVKLAGKDLVWVVLLFIPCVNIVVAAILFGEIAEKLGKPKVVCYVTPLLGVFTIPYLAFA